MMFNLYLIIILMFDSCWWVPVLHFLFLASFFSLAHTHAHTACCTTFLQSLCFSIAPSEICLFLHHNLYCSDDGFYGNMHTNRSVGGGACWAAQGKCINTSQGHVWQGKKPTDVWSGVLVCVCGRGLWINIPPESVCDWLTNVYINVRSVRTWEIYIIQTHTLLLNFYNPLWRRGTL